MGDKAFLLMRIAVHTSTNLTCHLYASIDGDGTIAVPKFVEPCFQ